MDLSEQASLETVGFDKPDNGEMFAAAVMDGNAESRLKTERGKVQTVDAYKKEEKTGVFIEPSPEYIAFCGGNYARAKVLAYVVFRYQTNNGKARLTTYKRDSYWWVESRKDIANTLNITEDQVRYALDKLDNVIESKRMRYFGTIRDYNNTTTLHIRLLCAEGKASIDAWPSVNALMRIILDGENSPPHYGEYSPQHYLKTKQQPKTKEQHIQQAPANAAQGKPETPTATPTPETPVPPVGEQSSSPPATQGSEKNPGKVKKPTQGNHYIELSMRHDMSELLRVCIDAGFVPASETMLSDEVCRVLYPLSLQLAKSPLEDTLETLIETMGQQWHAYCDFVDSEDSKACHPPAPTLLHLKKHFAKFINSAND